jgi:DNA-binding CsgD family transcriptional regulator
LRLPRGVGAPGHAWITRKPIPAARAAEGDRPRVRSRAALGPTLALPALAGEDVLAVVELYSASPITLGAQLLCVLSAVGDDLGAFLARRRGELELSPLTQREVEVLTLAADGLAVRHVGERLGISHGTVKSHLEHIYGKLGVASRTAAVAYALRAGLIE